MKKPKPEPLDRAGLRQAVIDLLSRRDYSRLELQRKLQPKAADADDLTAVLDDMAERRWQSDERFTDAFLHSRSDRYGPLRLTQELQQKGIADARTAVAALGADWQEQAAQLALRKFSPAPTLPISNKKPVFTGIWPSVVSMPTISAMRWNSWRLPAISIILCLTMKSAPAGTDFLYLNASG